MSDLRKLCILVVEDEYLIALDLARTLCELGAQVLGPVPSADEALHLIRERGEELDAAILDVNLGSHTVYPVADHLRERGIRFVFATGYDAWTIPEAYGDVPRCDKPINTDELVRVLRAPSRSTCN
jgi:CheY-like chemotaxis protein